MCRIREMEEAIECGILTKERPRPDIVKYHGKVRLASIVCYLYHASSFVPYFSNLTCALRAEYLDAPRLAVCLRPLLVMISFLVIFTVRQTLIKTISILMMIFFSERSLGKVMGMAQTATNGV